MDWEFAVWCACVLAGCMGCGFGCNGCGCPTIPGWDASQATRRRTLFEVRLPRLAQGSVQASNRPNRYLASGMDFMISRQRSRRDGCGQLVLTPSLPLSSDACRRLHLAQAGCCRATFGVSSTRSSCNSYMPHLPSLYSLGRNAPRLVAVIQHRSRSLMRAIWRPRARPEVHILGHAHPPTNSKIVSAVEYDIVRSASGSFFHARAQSSALHLVHMIES